MAEEGSEQNKSEEATPYKLQKARERGSVARGVDLGFFAVLLAFAGFLSVAGPSFSARLAVMMQRALVAGIADADDPARMLGLVASAYWPALQGVVLFIATLGTIVLLVEVIQLRGFVFSAHPLKPDFSRINPATGLKRTFSMRLPKEALKNLVKMIVYTIVATLLIRAALAGRGVSIVDASSLVNALEASGARLLWVFVAVAFFVAVIDQLLMRAEFGKQMRMSRRDVTREGREREGDPRLKRRRKQLHAEFVKRSQQFGALGGSDMLVVNPEHVAVALRYDRGRSSAPVVAAKGRDLHALLLKRRAARLGIPIFESPELARALHAECEAGSEIGGHRYHAVADLYFRLEGMAKGKTR